MKDIDKQETQEWLESLKSVVTNDSPKRAEFLLNNLLDYATSLKLDIKNRYNTPFVNTPQAQEESYPDDKDIAKKIVWYSRWNVIAMVSRASKNYTGLGGHISTYNSIAKILNVGLTHFFQSSTKDNSGDLVYFQGHCVEGIYAMSYLEGKFSEKNLDSFRREAFNDFGLSSYPHPWLMKDYWQFPTVSMGLGALQAIYQAKFLKYLDDRKITPLNNRKVWCFCGDGEMDEPESRGALHIAGRDNLDNLILVINCNLQRLDGPVYGDGKIVQELEAQLKSSGWNVIKALWGNQWDKLLKKDKSGLLLQRLNEIVDGELQACTSNDGKYAREVFFGKYPELLELVKDYSDDEIKKLMLNRGGHELDKIYSAFHSAKNHTGQPTAILFLSVKGYGLGEYGESENIAHNIDKLSPEGVKEFIERFSLPIDENKIKDYPYYRPKQDSPEVQFYLQQREKLGGSFPTRRVQEDTQLKVPKLDFFKKFFEGSTNDMSTTMAFGRIFQTLLRDKNIAKYLVPIFSDEARTFGMEALFRQIGIYSPVGQLYKPEDSKSLISYKESVSGQVLEEGITEAGCMCSWIAAASSYSSNNQAMIPFFIFYSMFGFQRTGDLIWAAADIRARGFLLGATAGRTALNGEGLQHQDGHSHLLAATNPNCVAYDPAFSYELAVIIQHGMKVMYEDCQNLFYYITLMNENYAQPAIPNNGNEDIINGIIEGLYLFKPSKSKAVVQLFGSGAIINEVLKAQQILEKDYKIAANVWSVTSYNNLARDGMKVMRQNTLHPEKKSQKNYLQTVLKSHDGPIIAASDYIRSYMDQIRAYLPHNDFTVLGTDGFGRSDTRGELRKFFEVSHEYIILSVLTALAKKNKVSKDVITKAIKKFKIDIKKANPWEV